MVKSMSTSGLVRCKRDSAFFDATIAAPKNDPGFRLRPPTSSRSDDSLTIRPIVWPMRPEAPQTTTFIMYQLTVPGFSERFFSLPQRFLPVFLTGQRILEYFSSG